MKERLNSDHLEIYLLSHEWRDLGNGLHSAQYLRETPSPDDPFYTQKM